MREFVRPMGTYRAATVNIRIDQWREHRRTIQRGIERQPKFAEKAQVWPEACRDDQFVDDQMAAATGRTCANPKAFGCFSDVGHAKAGLHLQFSLRDDL